MLAARYPHPRVVGGEGAYPEEPLQKCDGDRFEQPRVAAHAEGLVAERGGSRRVDGHDGPEHNLAGPVVGGEAAAGGGEDGRVEGVRCGGAAGGGLERDVEGGFEAGYVGGCEGGGRGGLASAEGVCWLGGEGDECWVWWGARVGGGGLGVFEIEETPAEEVLDCSSGLVGWVEAGGWGGGKVDVAEADGRHDGDPAGGEKG